MNNTQVKPQFSAWSPGLNPDIPANYQSLETLYQVLNATTHQDDIAELVSLTGLRAEELVAFSPERLVLHELIVRVTADIVIPEEDEEGALGRHFRKISNQVYTQYLSPIMDEVRVLHHTLYQEAEGKIQHILADTLFSQPKDKSVETRFSFFRLFKRKVSTKKAKASAPFSESLWDREYRQLNQFRDIGLAAQAPLDRAIYKSLYRVLGALASTQGYIGCNQTMLTDLTARHVCNTYGSKLIGAHITPQISIAIQAEGYAISVPAQKPILISLKGASAAGKSSLRPMLKQIMGQQGVKPNAYGTISPDIWRRLLLDFDTLGEAYKYAGALTSNEVNVIDSKLDRYIRDKAQRDQSIPHLLVDRFRFDSFSSDKVSHILHDTYAKYIDTLYMYFVITPPEDTVVRGWKRGLERGRYKAVEDFLGFSVEAYTGMPKLLFKWLAYRRPLFNYVFLDNSVAKGRTPKTIAFGNQDVMNIHNPMAFIDIERYQKINIKAQSPAEVYPEKTDFSVINNAGFLRQCISRIGQVNFIDEHSGKCYLDVVKGHVNLRDKSLLTSILINPSWNEVFDLISPVIMAELRNEEES